MEEECFDELALFAAFDEVKGGEQSDSVTNNLTNTRSESRKHTELDSLKEENKLLKKALQRIAPTSFPGNDNPLATIVYFDSPASRRGKRLDLEELMKQIFDETDKHTEGTCNLNNVSSSVNRSSFWEAFTLAQGKRPDTSEDKKVLKFDSSAIPVGSVQYFSLFCLDSFGSTLTPRQPSYERAYHKILPDNEKAKTKRRKMCFNCDGNHKLQECKARRDPVRINAKRQEFMDMFNIKSPVIREKRYHVEENYAKKFQHLVPGKVSDGLREALGLSEHDVPPFIYRMRMLGYPPGWLPSNHDSGIVLYGKEGKAEESSGKRKCLDPDKLVQFPGFNIPVPSGMKDLSRTFRLPEMSNEHLIPPTHQNVTSPSETGSRKHRHSSDYDDDNCRDNKRLRTAGSGSDMEIENDSDDIRSPNCGIFSPPLGLGTPIRTSTPAGRRLNNLEDGEIPDSPSYDSTDGKPVQDSTEVGTVEDGTPTWWLAEPLKLRRAKPNPELIPPPYPLKQLPLHKISQILPGEMNHISFEDRNTLLHPIYGNLQARTGRYKKLRTILEKRESKR